MKRPKCFDGRMIRKLLMHKKMQKGTYLMPIKHQLKTPYNPAIALGLPTDISDLASLLSQLV
ncbi:hypothetical protein PA25_12640 [Pseudoalteromonas sp. A25]|nr:hypothetical protein PA25_12640 [Pseudoalteromonas sp. A25]